MRASRWSRARAAWMRRATGSVLEDYGISIADAKTGVVEADNSR